MPYDGINDKFNFDAFDMENNDIVFTDVIKKLKGGKTQLIIELTGIWMAGGKYGCTWKVISGKFQLAQNNKMTFIVDSDTEKAANDDEEDDEEELDVSKELSEVKVANSDDENGEGDGEGAEVVEEQPKAATRGRKSTTKK